MNYCLYIKGASYITVDSVSIVANKGGVGRGTGFLSIHSNAYYALVKNCYMENGGTGSSLLVLGKGGAYVVFDHNYFNITGNSGNVISANQFVGTGDAPEHTTYTNNIIYSARPASAICYAMTVSGSGNLLENNTIYFNGSGILNQYGASSVGNVYRNNTIYGSATFNPSANSLVENNKVYGTGKTTIAAGTTLINNTFNTVTISGANVVARENTFNQDFTISGAGTQLIGNIVTGTVTVSSNDNVIILNNITATGDYAVNLNAKTGNTVTGNILIAKEYYGDAAVKYTNENNVVEDNYPMDIDMIVSAEPIFVGQDAEITISAVENFNVFQRSESVFCKQRFEIIYPLFSCVKPYPKHIVLHRTYAANGQGGFRFSCICDTINNVHIQSSLSQRLDFLKFFAAYGFVPSFVQFIFVNRCPCLNQT